VTAAQLGVGLMFLITFVSGMMLGGSKGYAKGWKVGFADHREIYERVWGKDVKELMVKFMAFAKHIEASAPHEKPATTKETNG